MKAMKTLANIFILFIVASIICCTKKDDTTTQPTPQPQDYRLQFVGGYICSGESYHENYDTQYQQYNFDTFATFFIGISLDSNTDNSIIITDSVIPPRGKVHGWGIYSAIIDSAGNFHRWPPSIHDVCIHGNFAQNKNAHDSLYISVTQSAGGFASSYILNGIRK